MVRTDSTEQKEDLAPSPSIQQRLKLKKSKKKKSVWVDDLIELYIEQDSLSNVYFDRISVTESNGKTVLLDSQGFSKGRHEFSVDIIGLDVDLIEIGVIGTSDIDQNPVSENGVWATE